MKKILKLLFLTTLIVFSLGTSIVHAEETTEKTPLGPFEITYNQDDNIECKDMLGAPAVSSLINSIYTVAKIAAVIIVMVFSMIDYTKAVASSDASLMQKATKRFTTRLIVLAAFYLVPTFLDLLISLTFGSGYFCEL